MVKFSVSPFTNFWHKGARAHPTRVRTGKWAPTYYRFVYYNMDTHEVSDSLTLGAGEVVQQYLVVSNQEQIYWWQGDCTLSLEKVEPGCNIKHSEEFEYPCTAWKHVKSFR